MQDIQGAVSLKIGFRNGVFGIISWLQKMVFWGLHSCGLGGNLGSPLFGLGGFRGPSSCGLGGIWGCLHVVWVVFRSCPHVVWVAFWGPPSCGLGKSVCSVLQKAFFLIGVVIWGQVSCRLLVFGARVTGLQGKKFVRILPAKGTGSGGFLSTVGGGDLSPNTIPFFSFVCTSDEHRDKIEHQHLSRQIWFPQSMCKWPADGDCFVLKPANALPDHFPANSRIPDFQFNTFNLLPLRRVRMKVTTCFD